MKMYNEKDDAVGWSVKMQCPYSNLCDHNSCNHHSIHEKTNSCSMTGSRFDQGCPRSRFDQGCPICESLNSLSDFIKEEEMVI